MKSGKAALVLVALAAQWALAGGPPSFASMHASRAEPADSPAKEASSAPGELAHPQPAGPAGQVVALQVEITR